MPNCKNCKTCDNRVFDYERGVYMCKHYDHVVRKDVYKYNDCVSYKEKKSC